MTNYSVTSNQFVCLYRYTNSPGNFCNTAKKNQKPEKNLFLFNYCIFFISIYTLISPFPFLSLPSLLYLVIPSFPFSFIHSVSWSLQVNLIFFILPFIRYLTPPIHIYSTLISVIHFFDAFLVLQSSVIFSGRGVILVYI